MTDNACASCGQDHPAKSLGEIGYESYNAHQGGKNYRGEPIPTWAQNTRQDIKAAWNEAGGAIADEVMRTFVDRYRKLRGIGETEQAALDGAIDDLEQRFNTPRGRRPAITRSGDG